MGVVVEVRRRGDVRAARAPGQEPATTRPGGEESSSRMTLRGGTVVCCQGKLSLGSGTPIIAGPLQLLILDVKYFENPRQKRRNVYCLARKREMEKNSELKGKT